MNESETVQIFNRMKNGDDEAAREVFERYLIRLVGVARKRLSEKLAQKVDPEDVVQSAFRSFFVRARDGQFAIQRAGDLWGLLATITKNKTLKKAEHFRQQKRDLNRDQGLAQKSGVIENGLFVEEPTEAEAVALADEVEFLLRQVEASYRLIVELRLNGDPIPKIADAAKCSERTVRRVLGEFREKLELRLSALRDN